MLNAWATRLVNMVLRSLDNVMIVVRTGCLLRSCYPLLNIAWVPPSTIIRARKRGLLVWELKRLNVAVTKLAMLIRVIVLLLVAVFAWAVVILCLTNVIMVVIVLRRVRVTNVRAFVLVIVYNIDVDPGISNAKLNFVIVCCDFCVVLLVLTRVMECLCVIAFRVGVSRVMWLVICLVAESHIGHVCFNGILATGLCFTFISNRSRVLEIRVLGASLLPFRVAMLELS